MCEANLKELNESALMRANAKLRMENNSLKGRLAQYRAQANHVLTEARDYNREKRVRDRATWAVMLLGRVAWFAAGGAVFCAAVVKLIAWVAYFAR